MEGGTSISSLSEVAAALDFPKSKIVHPVRLHKAKELLSNVSLASIYSMPFMDKKWAQKKICSSADILREWLVPYLDLSHFRFAYPTSGITEGLNYWLMEEERPIFMFEADYAWITYSKKKIVKIKTLKEVSNDGILYITNPSVLDGNYRADWNDIISQPFKVALDCAYLNTTFPHKLPISDQVDFIFFGFSKSIALSPFRLGWMFCRRPSILQNTLFEHGYQSVLNSILTEEICYNITPDYCAYVLKPYQRYLCQRYEFTASDSVLIATSQNPDFSFFKRESAGLRIPLAHFYQQMAISDIDGATSAV